MTTKNQPDPEATPRKDLPTDGETAHPKQIRDEVVDRTPKIIGGTYPYSRPGWREEMGDVTAMIQSPLPLVLEIGFAKGRFLMGTGQANRDLGFIGIESRRKWIPYVRERCEKKGLTNVAVVRGDAQYILPRSIPDGRLREVFVLFPDPWWKLKHQKRRTLLTREFLLEIARTLKPGGLLTLRTDVARYANMVRKTVATLPCYTEVIRDGEEGEDTCSPVTPRGPEAPVIQTCDVGVLTSREVGITQAGLPIYHHVFRRE